MAKATSRIKLGREGAETSQGKKAIEPGDNVPKEIADAAPWAVGEKEFKQTIDPNKQETLVGEKAAAESLLLRPDNPNRPASIHGEDEWKVSRGTTFGRDTAVEVENKKDPDPVMQRATEHHPAGGGEKAGAATPNPTINKNDDKGDKK